MLGCFSFLFIAGWAGDTLGTSETFDMIIGGFFIVFQFSLLTLSIRRLHDVGKSGWYYLIGLIPLGFIYLLYLFAQDSNSGANEYGQNPKET